MDTQRKPFRFRYANEIAGLFVVLALALIVVGVVLVGRARQWFEPSYRIRITFPEEGTYGLQQGSMIVLLGTSIGAVERIYVDAEGAMHAVLRVRGQFLRFIRTDSVAVVKRKFGIAGDAFIEITPGVRDTLPPDDAVLPVRKDTEITELLQQIMQQVQAAVVPTIEETQRLLAEYRGLAADLRDRNGELQRSMAAVRSILEGVERGEGSVGRILRDPAFAEEIGAILARVRQMTDQLHASLQKLDAILEDVRRASGALPETADTVRAELRDVPGLVLQTQATLREAEQLLAGLQEHWLLRAYMNRPSPIQMLPPPAPATAPVETIR